MCGRYTLRTPPAKLVQQFMLGAVPDLVPRYNVAPTQLVFTVRASGETKENREGVNAQWGVVPARRGLEGGIINARSESVDTKPTFADAFRHRRCLVLADGFYEWKRDSSGRDPFYIQLQSEEPFAFAGIWEPGQQVGPDTCAVITTSANSLLQSLHERMPVILREESYAQWLDPVATVPELKKLLVSYPADEMKMTLVSRRVNSPAHDDAACVRPRPEERFLF